MRFLPAFGIVCVASLAAAAEPSLLERQLAVLENLIAVTPDGAPDKPDLLFRAASLDAELAAEYAQRGSQAERDRRRARAIDRYRAITDNPVYRSYARMDQVLFYLAYELFQAHQADAARDRLERLIHDYPRSKFLPDAHLAIAEDFFERNDLDDAERYYLKVEQFIDSRVYHYARYKHAWVYFNRDQLNDALIAFRAVERDARDAKLASEAAKDAAMVERALASRSRSGAR